MNTKQLLNKELESFFQFQKDIAVRKRNRIMDQDYKLQDSDFDENGYCVVVVGKLTQIVIIKKMEKGFVAFRI